MRTEKILIGAGVTLALLLYVMPVCVSQETSNWNHKMSLSGGGFWSQRIPVTVQNNSNTSIKNQTKILKISAPGTKTPDSLPLAGVAAESIRVCDSTGTEYLFDLRDDNLNSIRRGPLPVGSSLCLSVSAEANANTLYYVYYGNEKSWLLPDWLKITGQIVNTDFENGDRSLPFAWVFDRVGDNGDRKIEWSNERPQSGKKCVKVSVNDGAEPSWIAARQHGITVVPGTKYRFTAFVRAENVKGYCGWYFHLGNATKTMIEAPMLNAGSGSFDWKEVKLEFTVPNDVDTLSYGTVLRGSGTAWFDHVTFTVLHETTNPALSLSVGAPEKNILTEYRPKIGENTFRSALFFIENRANVADTRTIRIDLKTLESRWNRTFTPADFKIFDAQNQEVKFVIWNHGVFFDTKLNARSRHYFLFMENNVAIAGSEKPNAVQANSGNAFPGTSQQTSDSDAFPGTSQQKKNNTVNAAVMEPMPEFLRKHNMVVNGDIEEEGFPPRGWTTSSKDEGVEFSVVDPKASWLGKRALQITIAPDVKLNWRGWYQKIKVNPNKTYLCGIWISTDKNATAQLHLHYRKSNGELSQAGMGGIGPVVGQDSGWTFLSSMLIPSPDTDNIVFNLTTDTRGIVRHDGLFLLEMEQAELYEITGGQTGIYQVPAIVKVFEDTTFSQRDKIVTDQQPAQVAAAGNEQESLQLALRFNHDTKYRIGLTAPKLDGSNQTLPMPEIFAVANVPVDYPTSYYQSTQPAPIRLVPKVGYSCDGWTGIWPDPLIPINAVSLDSVSAAVPHVKLPTDFGSKYEPSDSALLADHGKYGVLFASKQKTRAFQLLLTIPANTPAGIYRGTIALLDLATQKTTRVPYLVEVFAFSLPNQTACGAIYDVRMNHYFDQSKPAKQMLREVQTFMAGKKLCSDSIPVTPKIVYDEKTGTASCDWKDYDEAASWYFNTLGVKYTYMPHFFYCFGWGLPPAKVEGQNPYPGEYPYADVDRSQLRPEYKKAYQAKLSLYWNHLKEKGWEKHFVLYISDEPFYSQPIIIEQMKALCKMIHEVDPAIPIYSSTWRHVPEWDGHINVWGIGHYGIVPKATIEQIIKGGARIWWTTDGQMCLDTPYCAVERMLPWWCHFYHADVYEFWGANWYTYDPFQYGWHSYIHQSDTPGKEYFVRYPNGDGYILYPGNQIGLDKLLSSVRMEQAREGVEDAALLKMLQDEISNAKDKQSNEIREAVQLLNHAKSLVPIPNAGGRHSTSILSAPEEIESLKYQMGKVLQTIIQKKENK